MRFLDGWLSFQSVDVIDIGFQLGNRLQDVCHGLLELIDRITLRCRGLPLNVSAEFCEVDQGKGQCGRLFAGVPKATCDITDCNCELAEIKMLQLRPGCVHCCGQEELIVRLDIGNVCECDCSAQPAKTSARRNLSGAGEMHVDQRFVLLDGLQSAA